MSTETYKFPEGIKKLWNPLLWVALKEMQLTQINAKNLINYISVSKSTI